MGDTIPIKPFYFNDAGNHSHAPVWTFLHIASGIEDAKVNGTMLNYRSYSYDSVYNLYRALEEFPVEGKNVAVIGSINPWIEIVCTAYNAKSVTTVDYNPPTCQHDKIRVISNREFVDDVAKYDCIFSYSSIEHDGLGRYGDPLDPDGDIKTLELLTTKLSPDGILYLGVPCGIDRLEYNAHRIYGTQRWPILTRGWRELASFSDVRRDSFFSADRGWGFQPWILLTPVPK